MAEANRGIKNPRMIFEAGLKLGFAGRIYATQATQHFMYDWDTAGRRSPSRNNTTEQFGSLGLFRGCRPRELGGSSFPILVCGDMQELYCNDGGS